MNQSALFKLVGAPLRNSRWSWGAIRADGGVVLRVWGNEIKNFKEKQFVRITYFEKFINKTNNLGYIERLYHLELLKNGSKSFMIVCTATDDKAIPRSIKKFDEDYIYIGGELILLENNWWIEIVEKISISSFINQPEKK